MKIRTLICLLLTLFVVASLGNSVVLAEENDLDASVVSGCRGADSAAPLLGSNQFTENAQAIVLLEANTDTLMYAWNPDQQLHPAGLVKIMTALLAIENSDMSSVVTATESVLETVPSDARTSNIQVDEVFTVEQLLYCVLVEGSNDAAAVLADYVFGSQDAFVEKMNEYACELGCTNTVFTNVHGLHDENQLSTARDMTKILDKAIENEFFTAAFGTTHYQLAKTNKSEERELESSNHMMHQGMYEIYYDGRITGGRTGVNNTGLRCIATTSENNGLNLICVVLGSESKINDRGIVEKIGGFYETSDLLDIAFDGYETAQLLYEGQALKQYSVQNGSADVVVASMVNISSVVPAGTSSQSFTYRYVENDNAFKAPVKEGDCLGRVEIWNGSICLATTDLYALNAVSINSHVIEKKTEEITSNWWVFLIIFLVLIAFCAITLYVIRLKNIKSKKIKMRHKRKTRAMQESGFQ